MDNSRKLWFLVWFGFLLIQPTFSETITSKQIKNNVTTVVQKHVQKRFPSLDLSEIKVSLKSIDKLSQHIPKKAQYYKVSYNSKLSMLGTSIVRLLFYDKEDVFLSRYSIFSTVSAKVAFIKAKRLIRQNEVIKREDLNVIVEPLYERSNAVLFELNKVVGKKAAFTISKGNTIVSWMVKPVPIIQKDDFVKVSMKNDTIALVLKARALEDGALGDKIKLRVILTEKIVLGRITGEGHVKIIR